MKLLFENWRKFLNEGAVAHSGILKMELPPDALSAVEATQTMLPEEAIRLSPKDLHITLIHQDILKPFSAQIKDIDLPRKVTYGGNYIDYEIIDGTMA